MNTLITIQGAFTTWPSLWLNKSSGTKGGSRNEAKPQALEFRCLNLHLIDPPSGKSTAREVEMGKDLLAAQVWR